MILDFSKQSIKEILQEDFCESWLKDIKLFIENWIDESETLAVKTSGTTGKPKVLHFPKKAFSISAKMTGEFLQLKKGNSALLCLPIDYIAGKMMVIRAIILELKLYCIEPKSEIKLTKFYDFAAITPMQAENSIHSIQKIQKLLIGGAQISNDLLEKLHPFSNEIFETFGMTETLSHIAMKRLNPFRVLNPERVEKNYFEILPNITIKKDKRNCLVIKTPYFDDDILTNDVVELIDNTHFIWKGRIDNVINSGGIKLFPEEIEKKLKPFISNDFYITSQKNTILGEELVLIIQSKDEIFNKVIFESANLSKYEIPKKIFYKNEFKYTESGKIIRELK